ncbi:type II toxin-antitoxin system RelE/ParE family toxin [Crocosphaera sp. XPORK-15E]|uniref:type II toxin-antitoxin system RelE family toxin n=1 Tax=Crocosphaera sp. XPORK-15E TaxID=3110247 RepID=UPI002B217A1B|nr:type II toxin-antitoxin system RelE/ParE family toxin [Crocosphaera sp. XPORK-15E]MEA5533811.1 type II toxin-antitoxin system RelE/ParE family toxin [Crocosphaera sp. XPORK-15E]
MSYQIIIPKAVQKQIDKLANDIQNSVIQSLLSLSENPRPSNSLKMKNNQGYRLRVGEYRVLYDIYDKTQVLTLRRIAHRRDIYRNN